MYLNYALFAIAKQSRWSIAFFDASAKYRECWIHLWKEKVSEYDQEMPQSHTTDQSVAPQITITAT